MFRRDKGRGPRLSLSLQVTQPVKREDKWEVTALAVVLYGSMAPEPPREVVFDVNGTEFQRVLTDSESGQARSAMMFSVIGEYIVTAYLPDFLTVRRSHRFMVKEEKKEAKRPTDLLVEDIGGNGKYRLVIRVLSKDKSESVGVGVPKARLIIFDNRGQLRNRQTGADGTVIFSVPDFTEREKSITVLVGGTGLKKTIKLLGRAQP